MLTVMLACFWLGLTAGYRHHPRYPWAPGETRIRHHRGKLTKARFMREFSMADIVTEMYVFVQRGNTLGIYGNIPGMKDYI